MARHRIDELLTTPARRSSFTRLLVHASSRDAWNAALRAVLPSELCSECQVANLRDQVLTVHLTTASWATRLRFLVPDLLPRLNRLSDFAEVREVRIKVVPVDAPATAAPDARTLRRPPDGALLTRLADDLDDSALKTALLKLAGHARDADGPSREVGATQPDPPTADV